jgi:uncharacterized phage protein (TIGR02218 family)
MLRPVNSDLLSLMQGTGIQIAKCAKITTVAGVTSGFTSWNESLTFDSTTFVPTNSIDTTALRQNEGIEVGNIEITGILDSSSISDSDLLRGIYDNARIKIYIVDPLDVTNYDVIFSGRFGTVTVKNGSFSVDVLSKTSILRQRPMNLIGASCPYRRLGDAECNFNGRVLTPYRHANTIVSVIDEYSFTVTDATRSAAYFENGIVLMNDSGSANNQLEREIKNCTKVSNTITVNLKIPFPHNLTAGNVIRMEMGCNRSWTRCKELSNNVNYGGFIYIPGNEKTNQTLRSG